MKEVWFHSTQTKEYYHQNTSVKKKVSRTDTFSK